MYYTYINLSYHVNCNCYILNKASLLPVEITISSSKKERVQLGRRAGGGLMKSNFDSKKQ